MRIFLLTFTAFLCNQLVGQHVIVLNESDVDMKILTWHYNRYEGAQEGSWAVIADEGEGLYKVNFNYKGDQVETLYNDQGVIQSESRIWELDNIPKAVTDLLDYRIVKYKLVSFLQETTFEAKKPKDIFYRVEAKTKSGGVVIYWFDADFNLLPEKKDNLAVRGE